MSDRLATGLRALAVIAAAALVRLRPGAESFADALP